MIDLSPGELHTLCQKDARYREALEALKQIQEEQPPTSKEVEKAWKEVEAAWKTWVTLATFKEEKRERVLVATEKVRRHRQRIRQEATFGAVLAIRQKLALDRREMIGGIKATLDLKAAAGLIENTKKSLI